jgi:hypothetical protein
MLLLASFLASPQRFKWTGPDPAHHFSIAARVPSLALGHVPQAEAIQCTDRCVSCERPFCAFSYVDKAAGSAPLKHSLPEGHDRALPRAPHPAQTVSWPSDTRTRHSTGMVSMRPSNAVADHRPARRLLYREYLGTATEANRSGTCDG